MLPSPRELTRYTFSVSEHNSNTINQQYTVEWRNVDHLENYQVRSGPLDHLRAEYAEKQQYKSVVIYPRFKKAVLVISTLYPIL